MKIISDSTPLIDGYRMPAEFSSHSGCIIIFPERPDSWQYGGVKAKKAFCEVACAIAKSEKVTVLASFEQYENARRMLPPHIRVVEMSSDDAWARDVGPTCVINEAGTVRGIDWQFNAWGGAYDGLYANWEKDNLAASRICEALKMDCYDAQQFVLEGGSIHSDGEGTLLVTEACLLSKGRNPLLKKGQIEETLKQYLGAEKVIWLPRGIYQDETNEHVDNVCAFVRPGEVVLAWTDDRNDPQWELSQASLEVLKKETDARGRKFKIHKLPIPQKPVCITEEELTGFRFEEGEDMRDAGERLAASYVNFYISNGGVLVPQFGDEHDALAAEILGRLFPERKIIPVYARPVIVGGGNIHCITQQIPAGRNLESRRDGEEE